MPCDLEFADFAVVLARWETLADADGAHRDHERAHDDRDAFIAPVGNEVHLRAHCGTTQGAVLREIFDRFLGAEFHADWDAAKATHGDLVTKALLARTDRQRRADALAAIFHAAASTAPGRPGTGTGAEHHHRPPHVRSPPRPPRRRTAHP